MSRNHGLSRSGLERMHRVLQGYVDSRYLPGLVAAISRHGETYVDVLGTTDIEGTEPMRRDSIFRISSMSKPVTAVAALILLGECRLRLDDPIDALLPELAGRRVLTRIDASLDDTVPARRPITVRDLLTFRMGFGIVMAPPNTYPIQRAADELQLGQGLPGPAAPPAPDEWMRRLGTLPLMHQPGEQWMYNTGLDVLSVLIARAAGRPLEAFMRERIFDPLSMRDAGFSVGEQRIERLVPSYRQDAQTGVMTIYDPARGGQWSQPPAFPSGGAGLVATVDDYLAFGRMLLGMGTLDGARILSRTSVALMTSDQLTPAQKAISGLGPDFFEDRGWGFGLSVVTRRRDIAGGPGSYGWNGGMGTSYFADPEEEMVLLLLTQRIWPSANPPAVHCDFVTLAYQAIED